MSQTLIVHTEFSPEKRIFTGVSCFHHHPQIYENLALLPYPGNLQLAVVLHCTAGNTALRLARATNTTPEFWLNLESHYDLETAKDELGDSLEKEVTPVIPA